VAADNVLKFEFLTALRLFGPELEILLRLHTFDLNFLLQEQ
jgi:hypothetical protein